MENTNKFEMNVDIDMFLSERRRFIDWLSSVIGYTPSEKDIESRFNRDGKFELVYSKWNTNDQFYIVWLSYPNSSINVRMELNRNTYKNIKIRKQ